jgi:hypothetical protein
LNDLAKHLISQYLPYLIAFLLGVIVAWKGCGGETQDVITKVIDRPIPKIEYVDRFKTDTVRHVSTRIIYDTIVQENTVEHIVLDTLYLVDTLKIIGSWLTEVTKYDTTTLDGQLRLRWQNYQNLTENLRIDFSPKIRDSRFAIGLHANAGLLSDFNTSYVPLMGLGVQATVKKTYFSIDYGFNGQHYVGFRVGRNIVNL